MVVRLVITGALRGDGVFDGKSWPKALRAIKSRKAKQYFTRKSTRVSPALGVYYYSCPTNNRENVRTSPHGTGKTDH